jgi:hypothetical protein
MQDEAEPAAFAGGEREPARRREIGRLARNFGHDRAHGAAFERFLHGPQGIARARHPQDDETLHGQAHEIEPRPVKGARLGDGEIGLDPHRVFAPTQRPHGQRHGKTRHRAALQRSRGANLMQSPARKATGERLIERGDAKAHQTTVLARHAGRKVRYGAT